MICALAPHRDRQFAMIAAADVAAQRADDAVTAGWRRLMRLLRAEYRRRKQGRSLALSGFFLTGVGQAVRDMYTNLRTQLHGDLSDIAVQGYDSAADALVQTLPAKVLAKAAAAKDTELPRVLRHSQGHFGPMRESVLLAEGPREPSKSALVPILFPPLTFDAILAILRQPIAGKNWVQDLSQSTALASPHTIAHLLASGLSRGQTPAHVARDLLPAVQGVQTTARRIARTYGAQVMHHAAFRAHEQLGDLLVGYTLHSAKFSTSRKWHVARDQRQYFKNPKRGQDGYSKMPHPPLEPQDASERPAGTPQCAWNCLCWLSPILAD